ncbi:MAG TPA: GAF and ANTAR domain-containing protein, partial [Acidimicrobiia bacterium]
MAHDGLEPTQEQRLSSAFATAGQASIGSLCIGCSVLVGVMGAGVVLMPGGQMIGPAGVSDPVTEAVEEAQYTLGEGPAVDVCRAGSPVLVDDLVENGPDHWPQFTAAAARAGVRAVFGLPLLIESVCIGSLDLYHDQPGPLSEDQLADALAVAQAATRTVLGWQEAAEAGALAWQLEEFPAHRAEVHQATGMVSVHADVGVDDAQALLRAYAFA